MASRAVVRLAAFIIFNGGCGVFCNTPVDCETGKSRTFNPGVAEPETIVWKYSKTVDNVVKVLDWDPAITKPNNTFWFPRLVNRATLDPKTAALTILQVKKEDSGFYTCEIQMKGALTYYHYKVEVFDPVPKPEIKCVLNDTVVKALVCSVDPQVQAKFKWQTNEGDKVGERIDIPEGKSEDSVYYCIATNPVSNNSTEFSLKTCKEPQSKPGLGTGPIVGIVFLVIILLLIAGFLVACLFCREQVQSFLQKGRSRDVPSTVSL
ncbi:signaling lymphocytic activation molecule-like isoform X2 [Trichomycterus rosablanca]|uniref:signaling lymphocytic activation molecule-like isoform X2 n=1 Tax=Trichomycterus rosablanca TaxID=2290929 RepID=UPI002F360FBD